MLPTLPWVETFLLFYERFQSALRKRYEADTDPPSLWKVLGDELLFFAPLASCLDAFVHVQAFLDTVREEDERLHDTVSDLGLKAAAWTAGFPVNNFIMPDKPPELRKGEVCVRDDATLDFIGPQIDLGFRISKLATRQRFVISHDLAYVLCCSKTLTDFEIHYAGRHELRGIAFDGGYPVIWIESVINRVDRLDLELKNDKKVSGEEIQKLVEAFIDCNPRLLHRPFIDSDNVMKERPPRYDRRLDRARSLIRKQYSVGEEVKGGKGKESPISDKSDITTIGSEIRS